MGGKGTQLELIAFSLSDCLVDVEEGLAKYLRAVHRTALELAVPNCFGTDIGGFWLMSSQLAELRRLPDFYPRQEGPLVMRAVEAYITAQISELSKLTVRDLTVRDCSVPTEHRLINAQ